MDKRRAEVPEAVNVMINAASFVMEASTAAFATASDTESGCLRAMFKSAASAW